MFFIYLLLVWGFWNYFKMIFYFVDNDWFVKAMAKTSNGVNSFYMHRKAEQGEWTSNLKFNNLLNVNKLNLSNFIYLHFFNLKF